MSLDPPRFDRGFNVAGEVAWGRFFRLFEDCIHVGTLPRSAAAPRFVPSAEDQDLFWIRIPLELIQQLGCAVAAEPGLEHFFALRTARPVRGQLFPCSGRRRASS